MVSSAFPYFSRELLESAKVVLVEVVPTPPLTGMRLAGFPKFENMSAGGIPYRVLSFADFSSDSSFEWFSWPRFRIASH